MQSKKKRSLPSLVYVGVGSNMGNRSAKILEAKKMLEELTSVSFQRMSSIFESAPLGPAQRNFLNAVFELRTTLLPLQLLENFKIIERKLGRRNGVRWGPRVIDLDILLFSEMIVKLPTLTIPHPLMHQRRFVLEPLVQLKSRIKHPIYKKTMSELLKKVSPRQTVKRY